MTARKMTKVVLPNLTPPFLSPKKVLRFISDIVHRERLSHCWSRPHVISMVQFLLNDSVNSDTALSPFQYVFGSIDSKYLVLPQSTGMLEKSGVYLKMWIPTFELFVMRLRR
jgi:hypothetical protein